MWLWVARKKSGAFLGPNAGTWGGLVPLCALASFFTAIVESHHNAVCVTFVKFHMRSWGFMEGRQCYWLCTSEQRLWGSWYSDTLGIPGKRHEKFVLLEFYHNVLAFVFHDCSLPPYSGTGLKAPHMCG